MVSACLRRDVVQQVYPATLQTYGLGFLMPDPSPLGRLVRRRRIELGLTQQELADAVGEGMTQNQVSRLESGKTQSVNDQRRLAALAKVLGLDSDVEFILAAYAPEGTLERVRDQRPEVEILPPGVDGELIALVRRIPRGRKRQAVEILRVIAEGPATYE